MFTGSENFTVPGGASTNITNHHAATVTSVELLPVVLCYLEYEYQIDFRMIPLGDIDLRREIQVHSSTGVVARQREREYARRVYSAKVEDRRPNFTVVMYQGNGAEEVWCSFPVIYSLKNFCRNGGRTLPNICLFGESLANFVRQIFNCTQPSQYCSDLWGIKFRWNICYNVSWRCGLRLQCDLSSVPYICIRSCAVSAIHQHLSRFTFCDGVSLCQLCTCAL
jgi:hypothetical protein